MSATPAVLLALLALLDPEPVNGRPQQARDWSISVAGGVGARHVDRRGFAVPRVRPYVTAGVGMVARRRTRTVSRTV